MTSQGTVKKLTLDEFERELNDVGGPYSITSKFAKLKDLLQKPETDVVKTEAKELKEEIDRNGKQVLSEEGNKFLKHLIKHGCLSQPMDPKSRSTNIPVASKSTFFVDIASPAVDDQAQVQQSVLKDPGKVTEMAQQGKRAQESVAASGDKDKSQDVIRVMNKFLAAEDSVVPGSLQDAELELVLQKIASLKGDRNEKNRLAQVNVAQNTLVASLEEKNKSMEKKIKEHSAELAEREKRFNEYSGQQTDEFTKLMSSYEQLQDSYKHLQAEDHQIRSYANEMQTTASKFEQKLKRTKEEGERLKQQLAQQVEDNARQKQKFSEEIYRINSENKQLKSRISELAGAKLMDNNPDIADLSDPNRAMKLGEKFSSLYDDEWTDHFQIFTEKYKMKDEEAIQQLLEILLKTYEFCRKVGDEQMDILCNIFEHPCQNIPQALTMKPQTEKLQMTQKHHKELKDLRKKIALKQADSISKQYLAKESEEAKKGDKKQKQILDEMRTYYEKCVEVCWPMILHDPPVRMEMKVQPGVKIDPNRYRLYGGNGDTLEYLVWPPLLVEGGGLIVKGIAKPKKVPRTPKK